MGRGIPGDRCMHPKPSAMTLEFQAAYDPVCHYCLLMKGGEGPLAEWFIEFAETATSVAYLHRDQLWPGRCVVAVKPHVTELFHLEAGACRTHMDDVVRLATAIDKAFQPDKMNYECLGNLIEHVHWHLIPRYNWDFLWRRTIWEEPHEPKLHGEQEYRKLIDQILEHLDW